MKVPKMTPKVVTFLITFSINFLITFSNDFYLRKLNDLTGILAQIDCDETHEQASDNLPIRSYSLASGFGGYKMDCYVFIRMHSRTLC